MSSSYILQFLHALLVTIGVETVVLFVLIRKMLAIKPSKIPTSLLFFSGLLASGSTLPYLWFVLPSFMHNYPSFLAIGELGVFLTEAVIYTYVLHIGFKKALFLSFACNLISFVLGLLMQIPLH